MSRHSRFSKWGAIVLRILVVTTLAMPAAGQAKKPNILVIMGDDIAMFNISAYNLGMMGYKTPNMDRIAREGALFTDWYSQQSCTAGRLTFYYNVVRPDTLPSPTWQLRLQLALLFPKVPKN